METSISKKCFRCKKEKGINEFYYSNKRRGKLSSYCKSCCYDYQKNKIQKHKEHHYSIVRKSRLKREYGITPDDYDSMFKAQNGVCAACGEPSNDKILSVDHNHITGKTRELLCQPCNLALGSMKESPQKLRLLADYIEKHTLIGDYPE